MIRKRSHQASAIFQKFWLLSLSFFKNKIYEFFYFMSSFWRLSFNIIFLIFFPNSLFMFWFLMQEKEEGEGEEEERDDEEEKEKEKEKEEEEDEEK